jgi:hypothetical protein
MLKELVKFESDLYKDDNSDKLVFSKKLANVLGTHLNDVLKSRAVFILIQYLENNNSKTLV